MSADLAIGSPEAMRLAPRAPHLAPDALPAWRVLLESHWRARLERVTELSLAYHDAEETRVSPRPEGRALLRQAVAERRALAEIEAALSRLGSGRFGRCERCGGAVSAARLTRTPQARYCGSCETGAEDRGLASAEADGTQAAQ
jgi:RNA polymerase-binding transcription factor DksA